MHGWIIYWATPIINEKFPELNLSKQKNKTLEPVRKYLNPSLILSADVWHVTYPIGWDNGQRNETTCVYRHEAKNRQRHS